MDVYVVDVSLLVCKPTDEKSTLFVTEKFQLLTNNFEREGVSKVPLANKKKTENIGISKFSAGGRGRGVMPQNNLIPPPPLLLDS